LSTSDPPRIVAACSPMPLRAERVVAKRSVRLIVGGRPRGKLSDADPPSALPVPPLSSEPLSVALGLVLYERRPPLMPAGSPTLRTVNIGGGPRGSVAVDGLGGPPDGTLGGAGGCAGEALTAVVAVVAAACGAVVVVVVVTPRRLGGLERGDRFGGGPCVRGGGGGRELADDDNEPPNSECGVLPDDDNGDEAAVDSVRTSGVLPDIDSDGGVGDGVTAFDADDDDAFGAAPAAAAAAAAGGGGGG
jgi:hypothetical protein